MLGFVETRHRSPGPCAYSAAFTINSLGKYSYSKYRNSLAKTFNPVCSKRFTSKSAYTNYTIAVIKQRAPGPGAYAPKDGISAQGDYFVSTMQSSKATHFAKGTRNSSASVPSRSFTPGPGSYRVPSEFGCYEDGPSTRNAPNKTVSGSFYQNAKVKPIQAKYIKIQKGLTINKSVPEFNKSCNNPQ